MPSCGNKGCTLSVFFSGGKTVPCLFWWHPTILLSRPSYFLGLHPFPRRKEGHGISPSLWFDPHDWSSRPQLCFFNDYTYIRKEGTAFSPVSQFPSFCPHYLLTKLRPPRGSSRRHIKPKCPTPSPCRSAPPVVKVRGPGGGSAPAPI